MIVDIDAVRLTVAEGGWALDGETRRRVDAHWAAATALNPRLWNGRVFGAVAPGRPGGIAVENGVLTARAHEADFAAFLAWRDWDFPEIGIRNLFGSALVMSSDGALVYGEMGPWTANAGKIYPPGGSLEPRDVTADGHIDVIGSLERELAEETGLDHREARVEGTFAAFDGPRVSIGRVFRFDATGAALAARIGDFLASEERPELSAVQILRRVEDADPALVPPYARMFAAHLLGG